MAPILPGAAPPVPTGAQGRRTGRLVTAAVAAAVMVTLAVGAAFVVGRSVDRDGDATASPASTTTSAVTTVTTTTLAVTTTIPPPTTAVRTTSPDDTQNAAVRSDAAAAVDRYLAAGAGDDVDEFASQWAYPVRDRYGERGQDEPAVRAAAQAYWDRYPVRTFARAGPTTTERSGDGWSTRTDYRYEMTTAAGEPRCGTARLTLGFTADWRIHTANEVQLARC